jgi:hypothetical protein
MSGLKPYIHDEVMRQSPTVPKDTKALALNAKKQILKLQVPPVFQF